MATIKKEGQLKAKAKGEVVCGVCFGGNCNGYIGCEHHFHIRCLEKLLEIESKCPTCGYPTTELDIIKVR